MKKFITVVMSTIMTLSAATAVFAESEPRMSTVAATTLSSVQINTEMQNKEGLLITKVKEGSKNDTKSTMYSGIINKQEFTKILDNIESTQTQKQEALKLYDISYEKQKKQVIMTPIKEISSEANTHDAKDMTASFTYVADSSDEKMDKILTDEFLTTALKMGYLCESTVEFSTEAINITKLN